MKIYVTVHLWSGSVHEVNAYVNRDYAYDRKQEWMRTNEIKTEEDEENLSINRGHEFCVVECDLRGIFEKIQQIVEGSKIP